MLNLQSLTHPGITYREHQLIFFRVLSEKQFPATFKLRTRTIGLRSSTWKNPKGNVLLLIIHVFHPEQNIYIHLLFKMIEVIAASLGEWSNTVFSLVHTSRWCVFYCRCAHFTLSEPEVRIDGAHYTSDISTHIAINSIDNPFRDERTIKIREYIGKVSE